MTAPGYGHRDLDVGVAQLSHGVVDAVTDVVTDGCQQLALGLLTCQPSCVEPTPADGREHDRQTAPVVSRRRPPHQSLELQAVQPIAESGW